MQLSKFTDYAFRALIYLAEHQDKLSTVEELASQLEVSEHHLKKVIHKLGTTDYVISLKGRGGGLKLGLPPEAINLGEVLKVTEDNLILVECLGDGGHCTYAVKGCKLKGIISQSLDKFVEEFGQYSLKDIME
ncbi:MAG: Rrf2 family transcriptional regulator [Cellulosilyticaceae bacterium]